MIMIQKSRWYFQVNPGACPRQWIIYFRFLRRMQNGPHVTILANGHEQNDVILWFTTHFTTLCVRRTKYPGRTAQSFISNGGRLRGTNWPFLWPQIMYLCLQNNSSHRSQIQGRCCNIQVNLDIAELASPKRQTDYSTDQRLHQMSG